MNFDKETLSILRCIYRQKVITYGELKGFYPNKSLFEFISVLVSEKAIVCDFVQGRARNGQIGPFICNESKISCTALGKNMWKIIGKSETGKLSNGSDIQLQPQSRLLLLSSHSFFDY